MPDKILNGRIQTKIDTFQNWQASKQPLLEGELAIDSTNHELRYGDGENTFQNSKVLGVTVDDKLDGNSTNPVQNKVVNSALAGKAATSHKHSYNDLTDKPSIPSAVTVDSQLDANSTNPVQNKIINSALGEKSDKGHKHTKSEITDFPTSMPASDVKDWAKQANKPTYNATEVGAIPASAKGTKSGVAELDANGRVPIAQLPSYVDDVVEGYLSSGIFYNEVGHTTQITGETGKIYVDIPTNVTYRWSGSGYTEISKSLALGETSSTAYYGDKGKTAYDHSQKAHAPSDAEKNVIVGIQTNGIDVAADTSRKVNIKVPTKTSDLVNDSNFKTTDNNTTYDLAANTSAVNGGVKINLTGSDKTTDSVTIKGAGATNVTTDSDGVITVTSTDTKTDTNTKYDLSAAAESGDVKIKLTGNDNTTDTLTLKGSGATKVAADSSGNITISSTDTNTDTNTKYDLAATKSSANESVKINLTGNDSTTDSVTIKGSGSTVVTTDSSGVIDVHTETSGSAETVPWSGVTGKPNTYPPDTHTHKPADVGLGNVPNVTTNNQTPTFTEATSRANITGSGETLSIILGKIKRFFTDLKTVAFTGSYADLLNKPNIPTVPQSLKNPFALTVKQNGANAKTYDGSAAAEVDITPSGIGAPRQFALGPFVDSTRYYTIFAKTSSSNSVGNVSATMLLTDSGNVGAKIQGAWLVQISNRGSVPTMQVSTIHATSSLPEFGYYVDSANSQFCFGAHFPTYRGTANITVLGNTGVTIQDFGDSATVPTGWTKVEARELADTTYLPASLKGLTATIAELNYTDGVTSNIQTQLNNKAATHTHPYAGSASQGGSANSAVKLDTSAGSLTQPVYFKDGKPAATTHQLNATVPTGAKFTDTNTTYDLAAPASAANGNVKLNLTDSNKGTDSVTIKGTGATSVTTDSTGAIVVSSTDTNTTYVDATTTQHGLMSTADKSKLSGIANGAEVNVINSVKVNGTALTPSSKAVNVSITGSGATKVNTDASGNITISSTDTNTDTNTTYDLAATKSSANGNVKVNLTGSNSTTDSVSIKGSGATSVTTDSTGVITISSTDTNTTYSAAGSSLGLVKTGGDVTIADGVITVKDNSHGHAVGDIDDLETILATKVDDYHVREESSDTQLGHVYLSDNLSNYSADAGGTAATPLCVKNAVQGTYANPIRVTKEELDKTWKPGIYICYFDMFGTGYSQDFIIKVTNTYDDDSGEYYVTQISQTDKGIYKRFASQTDAKDVFDYSTMFPGQPMCSWLQIIPAMFEVRYRTRTATRVVASDISYFYSKLAADYVCDGTADQIEINNAISSLPSTGGKVVLLEGTYNLSGSININKPNVTIEGMGAGATVLQTASAIHMIHIQSGGSACRIKNLTVEKTGDLASGRAGIWIEGAQAEAVGVDASGFSFGVSVGADEALITNSYLHDNGSGVYLGRSKAFVVDSLFKNNEVGVSLDGNYNVAENNRIIDNDIGIRISDYSKGHHNKFSGNYIIRGTGQATNYSTGQYTIQIASGTYNDICDNYIMGKNYVNSGGTTNTFVNNKYQ